MTVRVLKPHVALDQRALAALLTPALLAPASDDDAPRAKCARAGTAWLHWGDALGGAIQLN